MDFPIISFEKQDLKNFLKKEALHMHPDVINKVISVIQCRKSATPIITVIDYSLPSNKKRLWVLDIKNQKLLFYTHLAHGIFSGEQYTQYFSNANNSRQSSLGVFMTLNAYQGREGTSLKIKGMEDGINDKAESRAIVMHGGHYAEEEFVNQYGRTGRSWGCPAIPASKAKEIIKAIKDHNLLIAYYPNDKWFLKSKFLNCYNYTIKPAKHVLVKDVEKPKNFQEKKDTFLFATSLKNQFKSENPPILTLSAPDYQKILKLPPPLSRMLRRSIEHVEYIAINPEELETIVKSDHRHHLHFVIPTNTQYNGHTKTQMKIIDTGDITYVDNHKLIIYTTKYFIKLEAQNRFIRWLGL